MPYHALSILPLHPFRTSPIPYLPNYLQLLNVPVQMETPLSVHSSVPFLLQFPLGPWPEPRTLGPSLCHFSLRCQLLREVFPGLPFSSLCPLTPPSSFLSLSVLDFSFALSPLISSVFYLLLFIIHLPSLEGTSKKGVIWSVLFPANVSSMYLSTWHAVVPHQYLLGGWTAEGCGLSCTSPTSFLFLLPAQLATALLRGTPGSRAPVFPCTRHRVSVRGCLEVPSLGVG